MPPAPLPAGPAPPATAAAGPGQATVLDAARQGTDRPGRWLRPWLALPVGACAVAALLAYAGPAALADAFRAADARMLAVGAAAYGLFFAVRGLRWAFLLRSCGIPGGAALPTVLGPVAWMLSTFLPFKAGDAVRAVVLARRRAAPLAQVAGTVAMERALDLAGLAVAASIGLGVLGATGIEVPRALAPLLAVAWLAPLLGLACALLVAVAVRRRGRGNVALRLLGQLLDGVLAIARDPRRLGPAAAWTLGVKAAQVGVYVALLRAFVPGAPWAVAALVPLFLLTFLVAFTPAHVGTYEAGFVLVFALAGLPPAQLAAAAVAVHLSAIAIVCTLGGLALAALALAPVARPVPAEPPRPREEALA